MGDIQDNTINDNTYGIYIDESGFSGLSGFSGTSGWSGWSGISGQSGISGFSGQNGAMTISAYTSWVAQFIINTPATSQFVAIEEVVFDNAPLTSFMVGVRESLNAATPGDRGLWLFDNNIVAWTRLGGVPDCIIAANFQRTLDNQFLCVPYESGGSHAVGVYKNGSLFWSVWPDSGGVGQPIKNCGISPYGDHLWAYASQDPSGFSGMLFVFYGVV
jgi:hypothetical protein